MAQATYTTAMDDLGHEYHEGLTVRRFNRNGYIDLCPAGHLYSTSMPQMWAGSRDEAHAGDPPKMVRCYGFLGVPA